MPLAEDCDKDHPQNSSPVLQGEDRGAQLYERQMNLYGKTGEIFKQFLGKFFLKAYIHTIVHTLSAQTDGIIKETASKKHFQNNYFLLNTERVK